LRLQSFEFHFEAAGKWLPDIFVGLEIVSGKSLFLYITPRNRLTSHPYQNKTIFVKERFVDILDNPSRDNLHPSCIFHLIDTSSSRLFLFLSLSPYQ
jgi:hypothetical protein